jgi:hypothetical protein
MKAFPNPAENFGIEERKGMDLRDYFAAKALPVAFNMAKELHAIYYKEYEWDYETDCASIADAAYCFADAMMKAREENYDE